MIPTVTFCMCKGGVGRTTQVYETGKKLSLTKTVLLVDADPSCNLTQLFLGDSRDGCRNIYDSLRTICEPSNEILPPVDVEVDDDNENLMLLSGSTLLLDYERLLSFGIQSEDPGYVDIIRGFHTVVQKTARNCGADIILIDVNSSIGTLNTLIIMFSTYFIVPIGTDMLSYNALRVFGNQIDKWMKQREKIEKMTEPYKDKVRYTMALPKDAPKLIRVLCTNNNEYYPDIIRFVDEVLYPKLQTYSMVATKEDEFVVP